MSLVTELKKNNGQFNYDHFIGHVPAYERAFKSLYKNKEWSLLYKTLKYYKDTFVNDSECAGIMCYRPGMDLIISYYAFYYYAQMMEKGIKGVVDKDKEESTYAYLQLLKRFDRVPKSFKEPLLKKVHLLLKHAYPDDMDNYSFALYYLGSYFYRNKDYKQAFKLFKKGADFDCMGRQIVYPFYLIAKNQSRVADMYRDGLGVKKNIKTALKYYRKSASNCGRKYHPKEGDFYLKEKKYAKALLCYTEANEHWPWRYSLHFMRPTRLNQKFEMIFNGLDKKNNRTELDNIVLAMMYKTGCGTDKSNSQKAKELVPNEPEWMKRWVYNLY